MRFQVESARALLHLIAGFLFVGCFVLFSKRNARRRAHFASSVGGVRLSLVHAPQSALRDLDSGGAFLVPVHSIPPRFLHFWSNPEATLFGQKRDARFCLLPH